MSADFWELRRAQLMRELHTASAAGDVIAETRILAALNRIGSQGTCLKKTRSPKPFIDAVFFGVVAGVHLDSRKWYAESWLNLMLTHPKIKSV